MAETKRLEERMAVLCKKLGNMWSQVAVTNREQMVSKEKIEECKLMVFGKLYTNPSVNYQAFFNTMKQAWKVDDVSFTRYEADTLCFTFGNELDKNRVLKNSPSSFSSHLLILQPWIPDKPPHCYKFKTCAFWVQVHGLPVEWCSNSMVEYVSQMLGPVSEVKVENRGASLNKVGKARVELDLSLPLSSGTMEDLGEESVWLDFKYERLPRFCYSCGKIGHYTTHCKEIPYDESRPIANASRKFGGWIRAEVKEKSPFWKYFYEEEGGELGSSEEECVPETQPLNNQLVKWVEPQLVEQRVGMQERVPEEIIPEDVSRIDKGKQIMQLEEEPKKQHVREVIPVARRVSTGEATGKKNKKQTRVVKSPKAKKSLRFSPYKAGSQVPVEFDETNLRETPICLMEDTTEWALVASPKKPLGYI